MRWKSPRATRSCLSSPTGRPPTRVGSPHSWRRETTRGARRSAVLTAGSDYWRGYCILAAWTGTVADTLAPSERDLFWFLCCLEEPDRERWILDANWADLWFRLGLDAEPPSLDEALAAVTASGLVATRPGANAALSSYALHPGVGEAGRHQAGIPFRDATDAATAAFWDGVFRQASGTAGSGAMDTRLLVRAGLAAAPYLLRQQQWADAARLLETAYLRDQSRANAAAMLPAIQQITRHDPGKVHVLATVLEALDPAAAETVMREYLAASVATGDYRAASRSAGRLLYLCRQRGRLAEALDLSDQQVAYTRQAGLGPWTQLSDEVARLQVLSELGQSDRVLAEVIRLRSHLDTLPATPEPGETAIPRNVRESLLDTGRLAARRLGRWEDALDFSATVAASKRDRAAPATDIARARFNDFFPLLELGRIDDALALLQDCLQVFQDARETEWIGRTLTALAQTEAFRGHGDAAVRLGRDALRYQYLAGSVHTIAASYFNLGYYLRYYAGQPAQALASHLAAALIRAQMGAAAPALTAPRARFGRPRPTCVNSASPTRPPPWRTWTGNSATSQAPTCPGSSGSCAPTPKPPIGPSVTSLRRLENWPLSRPQTSSKVQTMMVGWPGAAQVRLLAGSPGTQSLVLCSTRTRPKMLKCWCSHTSSGADGRQRRRDAQLKRPPRRPDTATFRRGEPRGITIELVRRRIITGLAPAAAALVPRRASSTSPAASVP